MMQGSAAMEPVAATVKAAAEEGGGGEQQHGLDCPRCGSTNTKFCYYNNYNLSQPRHFCKGCRRYWTKGGALRNVPVGGGTRKSSAIKRSSSSDNSSSQPSNPKRQSSSSSIDSQHERSATHLLKPADHHQPVAFTYAPLDITSGCSFSSLLASTSQLYGGLFDNFGAADTSINEMNMGLVLGGVAPGLDMPSSTDSSGNDNATPLSATSDGLPKIPRDDSGCWTGGWTDLAIYNPGSGFP